MRSVGRKFKGRFVSSRATGVGAKAKILESQRPKVHLGLGGSSHRTSLPCLERFFLFFLVFFYSAHGSGSYS
jgi:hypothetical protein